MFHIRIAGLTVEIRNQYDCVYEKCKEYVVDHAETPELATEATGEEILDTQKWKWENANEKVTLGEAEYDRLPYKFYPFLPAFDAFWLHAAVVELDGEAYAFSASSGYGKSTHVKLWLERFGSRARIINGDNPIIRWKDGCFYAYGTPFCGKEGYHVNVGVPLKGVCFLAHAQENRIEPVDPVLAYCRLIRDNWTITDKTMEAHMAIYERFVEHVPVYMLYCNQSTEAAETALYGMRMNDNRA